MGAAAIEGWDWGDVELRKLALGLVMRDPVLHLKFFYPDINAERPDRRQIGQWNGYDPENHLHVYFSQYPLALRNKQVVPGGRGTGKSWFMRAGAVRRCVVHRLHEGFGAASSEDAVNELMAQPILDLIEAHPVWRALAKEVRRDRQAPAATFWNGSRIQWSYPGQAVRGVQTTTRYQGRRNYALYLEEATNQTQAAVNMLVQQRVFEFNPRTQYNQGAAEVWVGNPDGRQDTPLYLESHARDGVFHHPEECDGQTVMTDWRWRMPSTAVGYHTVRYHRDIMRRYHVDWGQGILPPEYVQLMWGLDGHPAETFFGPLLRAKASRRIEEYREIWPEQAQFLAATEAVGGLDGKAIRHTDLTWLDVQLPVPFAGGLYGLGWDAATGGLSAVSIFWRNEQKQWELIAQILMRGWESLPQVWVVHFLLERYRAEFIGIDESSLGEAVVNPFMREAKFKLSYLPNELVVRGFKASAAYVWRRRNSLERLTVRDDMHGVVYQKFPEFVWQELHTLFDRQEMILPEREQAEKLHQVWGSIVRIAKTQASGHPSITYGPAHPDRISSLQFFAAGKTWWENRPEVAQQRWDGSAFARALSGRQMGLMYSRP